MPTVVFLKTNLQAQIAPGNDVTFLRLLQEADTRLLEFGKWYWTRGRTVLTPVDGYVTLPSGFCAILGAQVGDHASDVRAEDFEFAPDGVGNVEVNGGWGNILIDQGLNESLLRVYKVTGRLEPDEVITTICHKSPAFLYDPEMDESGLPEDATTETRCPDMAALKLAMLAIIFEEASDIGKSSQYMSTALRSLDNKGKTSRGGARQMVNTRANGIGQRRIRTFR